MHKHERAVSIAIASGKGGTGKTTIATSLAVALQRAQIKTRYIDCDVEEPNGHIFLKPVIQSTEAVTVGVPELDLDKCIGCRRCAELCQYSGIAYIKDKPMVFEHLCHSCGGCMAICPQGAINEKKRKIATAQTGDSDGLAFAHAVMDIGAIQSPTAINHIKGYAQDSAVAIIDAPPGTSCATIEAVKDTDFVLLVTEPTPFGFNDLQLAVEMARKMALRFAVIINRSDIGDDAVLRYCQKEDIDILLQVPDQRKIAQAYSKGTMLIDEMASYQDVFVQLYEQIERRLGQEGLNV